MREIPNKMPCKEADYPIDEKIVKKLKITPYDATDHLDDEKLIKVYIAEVRRIGTEKSVKRAIEDGKRACARYGLSLAAAGLLEDEAAVRLSQDPLTLPAASLILGE